MLTSCLRHAYRSVEDPATGLKTPIERRYGLRPYECPKDAGELTIENTAATFPDNCPDMAARFWIDNLQAGEIRRLRLSLASASAHETGSHDGPEIRVDPQQWPNEVAWPGMKGPLFLPGFGDFLSVGIRGFASRWIARDIFATENDADRQRMRRETLEEIPAVAAGPATVERNDSTTTYTQTLLHPRLQWATRRLELWNREPRARFTLRFDRISSDAPELFFATFPLPCEGILPRTSSGGMPFVPYQDQIPGSCRDYFSIDGWVHYEAPQGHWLWVSRDAPLVTFGDTHVLARSKDAPQETNRVFSMIFDNRWFTNFVGNSHGAMEFQFELAWKPAADGPISAEALADTLVSEPPMIITPAWKDDPIIARHLYRT
jgi:hypothetical protein